MRHKTSPVSRAATSSPWLMALIFLIVATGAMVALFWHPPGFAVVAMDTGVYGMNALRSALQHHDWALWSPDYWLGSPNCRVSINLVVPFMYLFQYPTNVLLVYAASAILGGLSCLALLRSLKLSWIACYFGAASYFLTGNVLTLVYAGHMGKFMAYLWLPLAALFVLRGFRTKSLGDYILAGGALGLAVGGWEVQVPYYCGLWFVVWAVILVFSQNQEGAIGLRAGRMVLMLGALLCAVFVVAADSMVHNFNIFKAVPPVSGGGDTNQNWLFATQYFFPPEEVTSLFTTVQFFGAPNVYWGRCGSPASLRLSDDYMGLLPLGFAILGGIACWRIWQARLFVYMGIGSLLISFGREGGLFWLLYHLPTMKSQRNPHRWLYFVSLAACVLAAYGVNWLRERLAQSRSGPQVEGPQGGRAPGETGALAPSVWAPWKRGLLVAAAAGFVLSALMAVLGSDPVGAARTFYGEVAMASPQGPLFAERARCMLLALTRTGFFVALSCAALWWVIAEGLKPNARRSKWRASLPWGLLLLVLVLDLGANAKRYIFFYPWRQTLEENPLANFLRQDKDLYRVKVIGAQQNPLLNNLVSNVLPYHRIPVVDPPATSRMPNDYGTLFKYFENHYVRSDRYFDFFNVKYVLSPGPFADPSTPFAPIAQWNGINVYRRDQFMPRAWLATTARVAKGGEEEVLKFALHPLTDLRETVVLEEAPKAIPVEANRGTDSARPPAPKTREAKRGTDPAVGGLGEAATRSTTSATGAPRSVRVTLHEDNRVEMETESAKPSILVLAEKWDADWKAQVDGAPAPILKGNFLMRAVELPAGRHSVKMVYRPSTLPFKVSAAGVLLLVAYGLWQGMRALRRR